MSSYTSGLLPSEIVAQYLSDAPISVDRIASALGLSVNYDFLGEISGKIERSQFGFVVSINASDAHVRQRFTLAHEIGHYILHRDLIGDGIVDDAMYRSKLSNYFETQANEYAAFVLMPPALFREQALQAHNNAAALAQVFDVSRQAAEFRLKNLRIA